MKFTGLKLMQSNSQQSTSAPLMMQMLQTSAFVKTVSQRLCLSWALSFVTDWELLD